MQYQAPYGSSDPNASYINGDPSIGQQGSIPPAPAIEEPMREVVAAINNSGFTPTDSDLQQLSRAIRQGINYYTATTLGGNPNALICTSVSGLPLDSYRPGLKLRIKVPVANTGPASVNVDSLGFVSITRANGAALVANDYVPNQVVDLVFDGGSFQITNFQGQPGTGGGGGTINNYNVNIPYVADSSGTPNTITANFSPAITGALVAGGNGGMLTVKLANTITGPTVIYVNGAGPINVVRPDLTALQPNNALTGQVLLLAYDGAEYQLLGIASGTFSDLIDTSVTYTVHGSGANFTDLNAAFEFLSKYKITHNGRVTLQLAAGQFTYSTNLSIDHPQNHRIMITGAAMLGPVPTTSGYTGIAATDIAMLRTKFATELHFTGGTGIEVNGIGLGTIDAVLLTGDGTGNPSDSGTVSYPFARAGLMWQAGSVSPQLGNPAVGSYTSGLAIAGFGGHGLYVGQNSVYSTPNAGPLVCVGNGGSGLFCNIGSIAQPFGPFVSWDNGQYGAFAELNSLIAFDKTNYVGSNGFGAFAPAFGTYGNNGSIIL